MRDGKRLTWIVAVCLAACGTGVKAEAENVALGATVSLCGGGFYNFAGTPAGTPAEPQTIVDGKFLTPGTWWNNGTVYWNEADRTKRWIEIDLGGCFVIESLIIQADTNDEYVISYWDGSKWEKVYTAPQTQRDPPDYASPKNQGMQTREIYDLPEPVVTKALKVEGQYFRDRLYSVSELQAFGRLHCQTVDIDIKPGSDPNSINLKSNGVVPVAVLTTDDFDAVSVDPDTVVFAGASPVHAALEDVDGDGDADALFHFRTQELALTNDSIVAALTAQSWNGVLLQGSDSVRIVPGSSKGKK